MLDPETVILNDEQISAIEQGLLPIDEKVLIRERIVRDLCATVKHLRAQVDAAMKVLEPSMPESGIEDACRQLKQAYITERDNCETLESQLEQLRAENERLAKDNDDLRAANLSNLLSDIKERLTPEEGEQFQRLLMSATKGWVDEITERTAVDRGLLDAFKGHPKKKKRHN